jgi:hypothetical protein
VFHLDEDLEILNSTMVALQAALQNFAGTIELSCGLAGDSESSRRREPEDR